MRTQVIGCVIVAGGLTGCGGTDIARWPPPAECLEIEDAWARRMCLEPHLRELARDESARVAVCEAARLQADGIIDDCHLLAHAIGETNLEIHEGDAGAALATCGGGCIEGCLHGVMQAFVGTLSRDAPAVAAAVYPLCDEVGHDLRYACIHGVGHGLRGHGFLAFIDALGVCAGAPDPDWAEICVGGVLMEQVDLYLPLQLEGLGQVLPEICAELEGDPIEDDCAIAIGEGLMFRTGHDLERSEELCLRLADPELVAQCVHGARVEASIAASASDGC